MKKREWSDILLRIFIWIGTPIGIITLVFGLEFLENLIGAMALNTILSCLIVVCAFIAIKQSIDK